MNDTVRARMQSPGPKKILACDGGGILGLMSVEILARLESDLRKKLGKPKLVLADYFDFVCGTSTGAIIATCIAAGMTIDAIRTFYEESGADMFEKASILKRLQYKYDDEPLAKKLRKELDKALKETGATLGSANLRTLLMMVMRNHSTDSPWPVSNNPDAKYNQRNRPDCNLDLPLWQLVRASTAAPTYFPPEVVTFGKGKGKEYQFIFVDGGVTTYNNPAFLAFLMATSAPYKINWVTGPDQLLVVSVGTGSCAAAKPKDDAGDLNLLYHATTIPGALMNAAMAGWDMACRCLGECRFGAPIDREFGDMVLQQGAKAISSVASQFAYVRYDPDVSQPGLDALGLGSIDCKDVQLMDSVKHMKKIQKVGQTYASKTIDIEAHLRNFL